MLFSSLRIKSIDVFSQAFRAGLRRGDIIVSIDGHKISDELDFAFFAAKERCAVTVRRNGVVRTITVDRKPGTGPGIEFYDLPIHRCRNRCIFCFIDQMPPGLRRGLYIKDEDFKHSFLNGNYVTLSTAKPADLEKVANIGLSPLYISVHATDRNVRNAMLGNPKAPDIKEQLSFLGSRHIRFHTQIVVCPGHNDKGILVQTIKDLLRFKDTLLSIAVVPVGLTRFRKLPLEPVNADNAMSICKVVGEMSGKDAAVNGHRRLFCADEFFIKAGLPIPARKYYEDFPQIENGVGLVRQFLDLWGKHKKQLQVARKKTARASSAVVVTSVSAFPYVKKTVDEIGERFPGVRLHTLPVENRYFGSSVTVAGLLTASDIIRTVRRFTSNQRTGIVYIPSVVFNYAGYTLDGYSLKRIERTIKIKTIATENLLSVINNV
jgi:putative radical SAM enzyme (TIGR03279 family)